MTELVVRRVLVALDASPVSPEAAQAAAELAAQMQAQIEGLFVEDVTLLDLATLSFTAPVAVRTPTPGEERATEPERIEPERTEPERTEAGRAEPELRGEGRGEERPVEPKGAETEGWAPEGWGPETWGPEAIERRLRAQAAQARASLEEAARRHGLTCEFQVVRGKVTEEILRRLSEVDVLVLGRVGWSGGRTGRLGRTAAAVLACSRGLVLPYGRTSHAVLRLLLR